MPDVIIQKLVINHPFGEPSRHFVFGDEGVTSEIAHGRRRGDERTKIDRYDLAELR